MTSWRPQWATTCVVCHQQAAWHLTAPSSHGRICRACIEATRIAELLSHKGNR